MYDTTLPAPSHRRTDWSALLDWRVDPAAPGSAAQQVYLAIRSAIVSGAAAAGMRLPSSRTLAARLGISRTTVVAAYARLLTDGYVEGHAGSGTFVSADLASCRRAEPAPPPSGHRLVTVPDTARTLETIVNLHARPDDRPFNLGRTLLDAQTAETWRRLVTQAARAIDPDELGYGDPRGSPAMRQAVCEMARTVRGVHCEPDQVLVTAGTQQAIDIAIRVLLSPGDAVWVEDPGYPLTHGQLLLAHVRPVAIPTDADGLDVRFGQQAAPHAKAAFVTPSSQYPTGVRMSMPRRVDLLAWARRNDAFIVEDDYASEFRFSGPPLSSLYDLDRDGRVIYVGTLNKALFPGLRLGFAVIPPALMAAFTRARLLIDRQAPLFHQRIVTRFLAEGHFTAHVRRMRQAYLAQRDALAATLLRHAGGACDVQLPDQGMHLLVRLAPGLADVAVEARALQHGIVARAVSRLYHDAPPQQALMLGFAGYPISRIVPAATKLARIIADAA